MILPNFIIIGAARAGTTSLYNYLKQHPQIYIPKVKEPRYFVSNTLNKISKSDPSYDNIRESSVFDKNEYYQLFNTDRAYKRYGEASVHYLYNYKECIPRIKSELGDISIIIMFSVRYHKYTW